MKKHKKVFKISASTWNQHGWNEECELPDGSNTIADIQDYS